MIENFMIIFVKTFFMNWCISYSFIKIKGYNRGSKVNKKYIISIILTNIMTSILYSIIRENINSFLPPVLMNLICYSIYLLIFAIMLKEFDKNFLVIMLMAMCFSFMDYFVASAILFYIIKAKIFNKIINSLMEFFIAGVIQIIIIYYFFKLKRFKDGFPFIKEETLSMEINIMTLILIVTIILDIIFTITKKRIIFGTTILLIIFGIILIIFLIQRSITNHYKSKMKDRTVEYLNEQIKEKDKIIENLKIDLDKTLKINHKYNHRISAMERAIVKAKFNEEFAEENNEIINLVKELAKDYKSETFEAESKLPKTNVFSIDNILEYMANKANNDNIEFQVDVKCNIKDLITNIVNQSKLATLLADHINDAIIAINYSKNELRKILVVFDKIDDIYEIKIYDTGIEFEIETLLKLGKEQITTHKDSGGTGIGFMTTFETLKESKGSLIIEEDNSENYSKAIIIKFDNNCEYKIRSHRADEIREQNKNSNIIIEKI